jgi:hypothetical protein
MKMIKIFFMYVNNICQMKYIITEVIGKREY